MKSTGYVLKERAYIGGASPPNTFEDESRFGNDGVHTDITWVQLPSGLWVRSFNGSSSKVVIPNHVSFKPTSTLALGVWAYIDPASAVMDGNVKHIFESGAGGDGFVIYWDDRGGAYGTNAIVFNIVGTANTSECKADNCVSSAGWYRIWGTYDKDLGGVEEQKLYIQGVKEEVADFNETLVPTVEDIYLGARSNNTGYSEVKLAFAKFLSYAPPAEQIVAKFQAERHWFGV